MLGPIKYLLENKNIILASGSSRRKEILEKNLVRLFLFYFSEFKFLIFIKNNF